MQIQLDRITKTFGSVRASDAISMTLDGGRIYAILGENGAGKSTLMKILSGYQPADSGRVLIDGKPVHFQSPADALMHGIGMLHQEPLDVSPLSVLDNFILGRPSGLVPDRRRARAALEQTAARLGFAIRPAAPIDSLTIGERQQIEITRLISLGARFLILDEPTTGISAEQKETLFTTLKTLAKHEGLTVALVSHKLEDVEALCDHVFVLRAGQRVGDAAMPISAATMVEMMFGKRIDPEPRPNAAPRLKPALTVTDLHIHDQRLSVRDVNIQIQMGEVVGVAGLDGSGQRAFLRACAGLERILGGQIRLENTDITHESYHERRARGIAFAAAGRLEEGLISGLTVAEHFALTRGTGWRVNMPNAALQAQNQITAFNVRGTPENEIQTLSGGNQQRVLLSMLPPRLALLLLENPTRGLDVDSAKTIWAKLLSRRKDKTAIVFLSPDLDEIIQYSDKIMVFFGGRATVINDPSQVSAAALGNLIGGRGDL